MQLRRELKTWCKAVAHRGCDVTSLREFCREREKSFGVSSVEAASVDKHNARIRSGRARTNYIHRQRGALSTCGKKIDALFVNDVRRRLELRGLRDEPCRTEQEAENRSFHRASPSCRNTAE